MELKSSFIATLKYFLVLTFSFIACTNLMATHNRAGEITFKQTGPLTIEITITTYTKASSTGADRDSLEFFWGDGSSSFVGRTNGGGNGVEIGNDIKINIYEGKHTFPGRGTYKMGFEDPNRVGGILNVNWPNSIDVKFFLSTTVTFLDPQFNGTNNSAKLLQAPVDIACAGKRFVHNPNAFDPDGDSLSYELAIPLSAGGFEVPGYQFPDKIGQGSANNISLDPVTGEFVWDSPQVLGEYNIAIKVNEWRNGQIISTITRDMQILVRACDNDPPTIENEKEICVIAGEHVSIDIIVDDINEGQKVRLTGSGAPFLDTINTATLTPDSTYLDPAYDAVFDWQTSCNHISDRPYQIVFKVEDNGFSDTIGLVNLSSVNIKVVGPAPENTTTDIVNGAIEISWDSPYSCENTLNGFFQGFSVWRRKGASPEEIDSCTTGLEKYGYERIVFNTTNQANGRYTYLDTTAEGGITYCYRVQAEFAQISTTGIPYNRVASLPSKEVCQQLDRNIPLITKVSVQTTDTNNGSISLSWTKPLAEVLDTMENPGPYTYELYASEDGGNNYTQLTDFTITTTTFSEMIDTNYIHASLNTSDKQYHYVMKFYSNGNEIGSSSTAASIYLNLNPTDMAMELSWDVDVPWSNRLYYIYVRDPDTGLYSILDSTRNTSYTDDNLANSVEYCYYINSLGSYALTSLPDDIRNDSQQPCDSPIDNIPPCTPDLEVTNICDEEGNEIVNFDFFNTLLIDYPPTNCEFDDAIGYYIYFTDVEGGELTLIDSVLDIENLEYLHYPPSGLSGCYAVSTFDNNRNESPVSEIFCVDNCPRYILPNTFTPNLDGSNDLFTPRLNIFIEAVDFTVYNEWGNQVWSTQDPALNWSGITSSGNELPEGVYYYTCRIFERRVSGVTESSELLKGYINLLR